MCLVRNRIETEGTGHPRSQPTLARIHIENGHRLAVHQLVEFVRFDYLQSHESREHGSSSDLSVVMLPSVASAAA